MNPSKQWIILLVLAVSFARSNSFKIASFNIQVFGASKAAKSDVMQVLTKVIQRYDIVLVQEIRDSKQTAIYKLLEETNTLGPAEYDIEISERLGRTNSKEQYAFLYRKNTGLTVLDTYQYPDPDDKFEREPFAIKVQSQNTAIQEFVLAGVHIDPDTAEQEVNSLVAVHSDLLARWDNPNIMVMGDFNADCSYLSAKKRESLDFRTEEYTWLIGDEVDTTVKSTDCAYDRFVMTGEKFLYSLVESSAQVFLFDAAYGLNPEQAAAVSDHYPIEFALKRWTGSSSGASTVYDDWYIYEWYLSVYDMFAF